MPASDQGVDLSRYMLVPRTLSFITREDKILLIRGAPHKRRWAGLYNGIGGHVEQGEDVLSAARREISEETGLSLSNLWFCGTITVDTQTNPGVGLFIFRGEATTDQTIASKEGSLEWIPQANVKALPLVADLPALLPKILSLKPGDAPVIAHSSYDIDGKLVVIFS